MGWGGAAAAAPAEAAAVAAAPAMAAATPLEAAALASSSALPLRPPLLLFHSLCHQAYVSRYVLCIVGRHSNIRKTHLTLTDSSVRSGTHWIKLYREIFS